ncbi:phosphotransferase [candidate division WOR-3 bacterium]|nr:phosphotransferase [candidate division WOR-3 bacterium]
MEYKIVEKISLGGSDRIFYRVIKEKQTFILVWDKDMQTYLKLQKYLFERGIAVPEIHWSDEDANLLLIEDLGNDSIYELTKKRKNIILLYRAAINELIKLQIDGYTDAPIDVHYDYEHMKWEQEYFKEYFLHQFCEIPKTRLKRLDDELESLAKELIKKIEPWRNFLMHGDYQSQNIYIKGKKAKIIDFQSARIGPLTYDITALLRDPYVNISKQVERKLIDYYLVSLKKKGVRFKKREFLHLYYLTALQRNMQVLGAFANLSLNKNKVHFKEYIPRAIELIQDVLKKSEFKELLNIVNSPEVCP